VHLYTPIPFGDKPPRGTHLPPGRTTTDVSRPIAVGIFCLGAKVMVRSPRRRHNTNGRTSPSVARLKTEPAQLAGWPGVEHAFQQEAQAGRKRALHKLLCIRRLRYNPLARGVSAEILHTKPGVCLGLILLLCLIATSQEILSAGPGWAGTK
jgi:hypothetical protein